MTPKIKAVGFDLFGVLAIGAEDGFNDELLELIDRLRHNGYKVGLFTNLAYGAVLPQPFTALFSRFDAALRSDELNHYKPDKAAYMALAKALAANPEETIFIDDYWRNVEGARAARLHAILYQSNTKLITDLQELGLKTD